MACLSSQKLVMRLAPSELPTRGGRRLQIDHRYSMQVWSESSLANNHSLTTVWALQMALKVSNTWVSPQSITLRKPSKWCKLVLTARSQLLVAKAWARLAKLTLSRGTWPLIRNCRCWINLRPSILSLQEAPREFQAPDSVILATPIEVVLLNQGPRVHKEQLNWQFSKPRTTKKRCSAESSISPRRSKSSSRRS